MHLALLLASLLAAKQGANSPDAGVPRSIDAGYASEDEALLRDLELLENVEILERLEQLDLDAPP